MDYDNTTIFPEMDDFPNGTFLDVSTLAPSSPGRQSGISTTQIVAGVSYVLGVIGNVAALAILCLGRKYRNRKHTLMLRFLASNDLVALLGMMVMMYLQVHLVSVAKEWWYCAFRVVWRFFGLSSGCIAIVMAVERWLALTHPFLYQKVRALFLHQKVCALSSTRRYVPFPPPEGTCPFLYQKVRVLSSTRRYVSFPPPEGKNHPQCTRLGSNPDLPIFGSLVQHGSSALYHVATKHVTHNVIMRAIFGLWFIALVLVCLPFLGFGLYYLPERMECVRYKLATTLKDKAYAYLFFSIGLLMVVCIALCNLAVIRVLCHMGCRDRSGKLVVGRRISRNSSRSRSLVGNGQQGAVAGGEITFNSSTREEVTFAKLMAVLCIVFVICWLPQVLGIVLTQFFRESKLVRVFSMLADILLSFHYTLDPYIYVLLRCQRQPGLPNFFKVLCRACRKDSRSPSHPGSLVMTEQEHLDSMDGPSSRMGTSICLVPVHLAGQIDSLVMTEHKHSVCLVPVHFARQIDSLVMTEHKHSICLGSLHMVGQIDSLVMTEHRHNCLSRFCAHGGTDLPLVMTEHKHSVCLGSLHMVGQIDSLVMTEHRHNVCLGSVHMMGQIYSLVMTEQLLYRSTHAQYNIRQVGSAESDYKVQKAVI
uniref:G-protein coupled receptors family 1 profile domain-containing protein n=1 Tax=Timema cristinae TaxID=61476 RepID=A0A7R9CU88_TIMCR|nr:unnamed protein product [Timema cristinae]